MLPVAPIPMQTPVHLGSLQQANAQYKVVDPRIAKSQSPTASQVQQSGSLRKGPGYQQHSTNISTDNKYTTNENKPLKVKAAKNLFVPHQVTN